jgi:WD40 repeat protein
VACGSASAGGTRGAGLVAAASLAGGVVLWDPATGKILDVNDGAFASEKDVSDKDVSDKDSPPANDEETRGPSTNRVASDVWFSDGGDVLACAFADGGVRVFDVGGGGGGGGGSNSTGSKNLNLNLNLNRHTDLKGHAERVTSLCFARGDAIVVTASADRTAKAWRVRDDATGRLFAAAATRPFLDMNRHAAALTCVTPCGYGPISGQHIITCDARGGWRVWSLVTGKCVKKTTWGGDRGADGITKCVALPSKPTSSKQQQTKRTDEELYDEGDDDDDDIVRFATAHYYVDEDASRILVWEVSLGESPSPSRRVCPTHWSPYDRVRVVNADP